MKLRLLFSLILLAPQSARSGSAEASVSRKGDEALAAGLWEVAEMHFRHGLADASLTPEAKSKIALRLAESLIRAGNPAEALEILDQSRVETDPETPFWRALALAGQHRFSAAAEILSGSLANPTAPKRGSRSQASNSHSINRKLRSRHSPRSSQAPTQLPSLASS
jgi:thioredoxin-like negative regulator of GroEL